MRKSILIPLFGCLCHLLVIIGTSRQLSCFVITATMNNSSQFTSYLVKNNRRYLGKISPKTEKFHGKKSKIPNTGWLLNHTWRSHFHVRSISFCNPKNCTRWVFLYSQNWEKLGDRKCRQNSCNDCKDMEFWKSQTIQDGYQRLQAVIAKKFV